MRGRFGAIDAIAPFDRVQIDLEDAFLVHPELEHRGDDEFLRLADIALLPRQEKVARKLLRDGRAARDDPSARLVLLPRLEDGVGFVAVVAREVRILRRDDRALQVARDLVVRNPCALY